MKKRRRNPMPVEAPAAFEPRERAAWKVLRPVFVAAEEIAAREAFLRVVDGAATAGAFVRAARLDARLVGIDEKYVRDAVEVAALAGPDPVFPRTHKPAVPAPSPEED